MCILCILSTFLPCIVLCAAAADSFSVSLSVVMSCCDQPLCFYYCHCFLSASCRPFLSLLSASVFSRCLRSSAEPQCIMSAVPSRHSAVLLFSNDRLPSLLACSVFLQVKNLVPQESRHVFPLNTGHLRPYLLMS